MKTQDQTLSDIILSWATSNKNPAREITIVGNFVRQLSKPDIYPSACILQPFAERAERLVKFPPPLLWLFMTAEKYQYLQDIAEFYRDPHLARDGAIEQFTKDELQRMKSFFDKIEINRLTKEQRLAVVTDEDATLVLAAAGSGKTSVIVAKAAYLIERKIRKPSEILLMCYGKEAANEMSERIKKRYETPMKAFTFHSLGNEIIADVEGSKDALAPHAEDDFLYKALLRKITIECGTKNEEFAALLLEWFSEFFRPYKSDLEFKTLSEYNTHLKNYARINTHTPKGKGKIRTLNGEGVRSFEELIIANWLYMNGIKYEYEPYYEHDLPNSGRTKYTPDFRLTESGVYIEHFGVRKQRRSDGTGFDLVTAPYVPRDEYIKGIKWKIDIHKKHGTTLIQTYSQYHTEGRLTSMLDKKLKPYVTIKPIPFEQVFKKLDDLNQTDCFTGLAFTFLKLFKGANITIEYCHKRNKKLNLGNRGKAFLKIFKFIYDEYQTRLGRTKRIDFEDMIIRATKYIESGQYQSPFRHILVDEFQDISKGRADLLHALKAQDPETRIFAVGDDWQSIYRFSGADVYLMSNFGAEFGGHFANKDGVYQTVDLGRTFRSVDKIATPAREFILKNPAQLSKKVRASKNADKKSIFVVWTDTDEGEDNLKDILKKMNTHAVDAPVKPVSVLLLGRYHYTAPENLTALNNRHSNLSIKFKTIHAAKGAEADRVIILRANSGRHGFPNEIDDDPILNLVLPTGEPLPHAEERRVFYVALTRARKSVTILASSNNPSSFVTELLENPDYDVIAIGKATKPPKPCPACGGRMLLRSGRSKFWGCVNYPLCEETRNFVEPPVIQEPLTTNNYRS